MMTQFSWKQRLISFVLLLSLFSTSVLASPDAARTVVVSLDEYQKEAQIRLTSSGFGTSYLASLSGDVLGFFAKLFGGGKQQRVERIVILPTSENNTL
ncbi:MAG TPA: hypothetical protein PKY82_21050, partial [Pyrinomonadaceae bacterium]|nr:hypothetical protein [Pyrinomonadaceae bacterium]